MVEKSCKGPVYVGKVDQLIINCGMMEVNHPYDVNYEAHNITVIKDEYGKVHIIRSKG